MEKEEERQKQWIVTTLKRLQDEHMISQAAFAEIVGVTQSAISRAMSGRSEIMLSTAIKLSKALGIPIEEFVHPDDRVAPQAQPAPSTEEGKGKKSKKK
jgi:transcriptional regulator with XRE-family HTH domain